ncbi:MAG: hypothetical protein C3F08_04335 [Candidatus Methylomirabilota bacterium]|nr:MAG: hypothetical protein C3F08_04335 [candidate division NC10 bacterium]
MGIGDSFSTGRAYHAADSENLGFVAPNRRFQIGSEGLYRRLDRAPVAGHLDRGALPCEPAHLQQPEPHSLVMTRLGGRPTPTACVRQPPQDPDLSHSSATTGLVATRHAIPTPVYAGSEVQPTVGIEKEPPSRESEEPESVAGSGDDPMGQVRQQRGW